MNKKKNTKENVRKAIAGKHDIVNLLNLIAGKNKKLTVYKVKKYCDVIMLAVKSMRSGYRARGSTGKSYIEYYNPAWQEIEAGFQEEKWTKFLSGLVNLKICIENW